MHNSLICLLLRITKRKNEGEQFYNVQHPCILKKRHVYYQKSKSVVILELNALIIDLCFSIVDIAFIKILFNRYPAQKFNFLLITLPKYSTFIQNTNFRKRMLLKKGSDDSFKHNMNSFHDVAATVCDILYCCIYFFRIIFLSFFIL